MNLKDAEERQFVKEFLTFANNMLKIKSPELLEKDFNNFLEDFLFFLNRLIMQLNLS